MRSSGILMPIFSLPSPYGIGSFGKDAYAFADFLKKAGQRYWQLLPLNTPDFANSPYQSVSSAAGNPYFIDLPLLEEEGLLRPEEYVNIDFGDDPTRVDYGKLAAHRLAVLRCAFARFDRDGEAFAAFCREQADWLEEYALFAAIREQAGGASRHEWDEGLRRRMPAALREARERLAEEIAFYKFVQYLFYSQWYALKAYANAQGIRMIGDIPMYVADDSADVWAHPREFDLDEELLPRVVAGCPPDAFSPQGQRWGMPVYDWEAMKRGRRPYAWWRDRIRRALRIYDVIRLDHFRGFEAFYAIPYAAAGTENGEWRKAAGAELFRALRRDNGAPLPIIAEDLGFLTPEVRSLLKETGFAGMKVLQFAFDTREESAYLPHCYERNCVAYTGTHDNDTVLGWEKTAAPSDVEYARKYLHAAEDEGLNWTMMRAVWASVADVAIVTMPDLVGLGSEGRINVPSTTGNNWQWRIERRYLNDWLAGLIRDNVALYGRLPPDDVSRS